MEPKTLNASQKTKKTPVGDIPVDWGVAKIEQVISSLHSGIWGDIPSSDEPAYPVIRSTDIGHNGEMDLSNVAYRKIPAEKVEKYKLQNNDILIVSSSGSSNLIGRTSLFKQNPKNKTYLFSNFMLRLRANNNITPLYLNYYLNSSQYYKFLKSFQETSTGLRNFPKEDFRAFKISLPPFPEQQKIAEILSSVDMAIDKTQAVIEQTQTLKKGLMQELLTRGIPGRHKKFKKTELGEIPADWEVKSFDELFKFLPTASYSKSNLVEQGEINYIHYGGIHSKWKLFLNCSLEKLPFIPIETVKNLPFLEEGDLIIADASEDYEGIGASIEIKNIKNKKIISGLHTLLLRGNKKKISDGYKAYLTLTPVIKNQLIKMATGISVYGISKTSLKNVKIPLPSIDEQKEIAKILNAIDESIIKKDNMLISLINLKSALMQVLLTGKVRVKLQGG